MLNLRSNELENYINSLHDNWRFLVYEVGEGLICISVEHGTDLATLMKILSLIKKANSKKYRMTAMVYDKREIADRRDISERRGDYYELYANFEEK